MRHFILNLAPTGIVPNKAMTPHVPLTPDEVATDISACAELGITYAHIHARDDLGFPSSSADGYSRYIERLRNAIPELPVCVSCSGRIEPGFEPRARVLSLTGDLRPDMASLTLSSLNFSRSASINEPDTIIRLAARMYEQGIVPELEIFDVGMLNYALHLIDHGHLRPPYYFNIILGNLASAQVDALHFSAILRDLPKESLWSVGGIGSYQLKANALSLMHGGGARTGLEDNIWYDEGRQQLATNIDLVRRCVKLAALFELSPMPAAEFKRWLKTGHFINPIP
jgi:3-keto-5-aminohexanoate cleavage enzyme